MSAGSSPMKVVLTNLFRRVPLRCGAFPCIILLFIISTSCCARGEVQDRTPLHVALAQQAGGQNNSKIPQAATRSMIAPVWLPLVDHLSRDGISGDAVIRLFATLPAIPTQSPMGRKIYALYKRKFLPQSKKTNKHPLYYKGVVNNENAVKCKKFIEDHITAFQYAERKYSVPAYVAVSLLFVETRLGTVLADVPENAFFTLASMAVCTEPSSIRLWLNKLKNYKKHIDWIKSTMLKRSDWAYNEVKALVKYMIAYDINPSNLPSSIYGAVGLCQFMPSNIFKYAEDGNGDGRIDLFNVHDAVASLSKYLFMHGWRSSSTPVQQHKYLMAYNHSETYANTILALGDLVKNLMDFQSKSVQK